MDFIEELNRRFLLQEEYLGTDKPVNKVIPIVSVTVTTYQQLNYIKYCLNGILMQETNFPYEVIVGEDESDDGTREICIKYAEKYPDKIRLFLRNRKLSQYYENGKLVNRFNGIWTRMSSRGKYIALCEGDDYWTDPYKLQKQVELLEANPKCSLCFHNSLIIFDDKSEVDRFFCTNLKDKQVFKTKDLILKNWFVPTASILYNKSNLPNLPTWSKYVFNGDMLIQLLISLNGNLIYIDEVMAVYRKNVINSESTIKRNISFFLDRLIFLLLNFNKFTKYRYSIYIYYRVFIFYLKKVKAITNYKIDQPISFWQC
jgi:glycosyltransferase involved in cell wall biosynthesis